MNTYLKRAAFAIIAVAAAGLVMNSASGGFLTGEPLKQVVAYGDLNLQQPEGVTSLYKRLQEAAFNVCAPLAPADMTRSADLHSCIAGTISRAVMNINVPALTAYDNAHNDGGNRILVAGQP